MSKRMLCIDSLELLYITIILTGRKVEFPAIGKVKYSYLTDHMSFTFPTSGQMSWW